MEEFLNKVDWQDIASRVAAWFIGTIPAILLILFLGFIALRIWGFAINRIQNTLIERALKESKSSLEAEKKGEYIDGHLEGRRQNCHMGGPDHDPFERNRY